MLGFPAAVRLFETAGESVVMMAVRATLAVRPAAGTRQRLVHDSPDGASTPSALGTTAKATVDLSGRTDGSRTQRRAHVTVAQYVARTDNHGAQRFPSVFSSFCNYTMPPIRAKGNLRICTYSNLRLCSAPKPERLPPHAADAFERPILRAKSSASLAPG